MQLSARAGSTEFKFANISILSAPCHIPEKADFTENLFEETAQLWHQEVFTQREKITKVSKKDDIFKAFFFSAKKTDSFTLILSA